jgi:two-component system, response regulator PdtaR
MGYRVLIVEDESIVAEDLRNTLEDWGNTVIGAVSNGRTALEIAREFRPDFVLMDVKINGDLNGVETALVIDSFFQEEVPVVFLSAHASHDYPVLKAVTKYVYLNKPFSSEELLRAIKSLQIQSPGDHDSQPTPPSSCA